MDLKLFLPHVIILIIAGFFCLLGAVIAWRRRKVVGGAWLFIFMVLITVWLWGNAAESALVERSAKIFANQISYIGSLFSLPLMMIFVLVYTDNLKKGDRKVILYLLSLPGVSLIMTWTNAWHGLVWSGFREGNRALNLLIYEHGIFFWVIIAYNFVLMVSMILFLIREYVWAAPPFRLQILSLVAISLLPMMGGLLYLSDYNPVPGLDWTGLFLAVAGILLLFSLYRTQLLIQAPIVHESLLKHLGDGVVVVDMENHVVDINPAALALLGISLTPIGQTLESLLPAKLVIPPGETSGLQVELSQESNEDPLRDIEISVTNLYSHSNRLTGRLLILHDVSDWKQAERNLQFLNNNLQIQLEEITCLKDQLKELSLRDSLTNLYNRRFLEEDLSVLLPLAERERFKVAFLMIDIDHFKQVNDTHGHTFGDEVLQKLAESITQQTRREDIACRYGGEEFIIIMPRVSKEIAIKRAEQIRQSCAQLKLSLPIHLTVSIGVALYPDHGQEALGLIDASDQALYQAKQKGRNQVVFYNSPGKKSVNPFFFIPKI